jgi:acetyl/propionyl-CoA carboxylase alpha subunit
MIGKLIVHAPDRATAIARLEGACRSLLVGGIATNRPWLLALLARGDFRSGDHTLATAERVVVPDAPDAAVARLAEALLPGEPVGSAWQSVGPFRIVSPATHVFHGETGWERRVQFVRRDGEWTATTVGNRDDGDRTEKEVVVIDTEDGFDVSDPSGRWLVRPGPKPRERAGTAAPDGVLRAPMPGTVVAVNVEPGQRVTEGETLAVMTAMKIEMTLAAPFDGVVSSVGCAPGDLVGSRQPLVTVTPEAGSEATDG